MDNTIDYIYDIVDEAGSDGNYGFIDSLLVHSIPGLHLTDINIVLAVLTVSSWYKSKLTQRENFYNRCQEMFQSKYPDTWERFLVGLK